MYRLYQTLLNEHIAQYRQMAFLIGPRQVGKTTISKKAKSLTHHFVYLNWDYEADQQLILAGHQAIADRFHLFLAHQDAPIIVFDEIHKYPHWRNFLKGLYDKHEEVKWIVTGSAKLDVFRQGGDSLMGRYFPYHVHPMSVRECVDTAMKTTEISPPQKILPAQFEHLLKFGGFPEPLTQLSDSFYQKWSHLRHQQLFEEDIQDLSRIQAMAQLKLLAQFFSQHSGNLINYSNLAKLTRVSIDTIQSWTQTLSSLYYCFLIPPWSKNIPRSLLKQPKVYLWDWSTVSDQGARHENFIASHLLKAVHFWADCGMGQYALFFIRDKEKREVDFLITKNDQPWMLVEVKSSANQALSKHLYHFQAQTKAPYAFQVVFDQPFIEKNCFDYTQPTIVSAQTFLSQLV